MFCPKCGSILLPKNIGGKKVMACSCGYVEKTQSKIKEQVDRKESKVEVVDSKSDATLPETDAECPKCSNRTAFYWTVQTRAGDEAETKFLKCTKCEHIWRDYG